MTGTKDTTSISAGFVYCRKLLLQHQSLDTEAAVAGLKQLPGMQQVNLAKGRTLVLRYDTSQLQLDLVLRTLEKLGVALENGRWQRIRIAWYVYVDSNAQSNARRRDAHCCNKPPVMSKRKR